jgi:hypothetical protein
MNARLASIRAVLSKLGRVAALLKSRCAPSGAFFAALVITVAALGVRPAYAGDAERAAALFKEGRAAMSQGDLQNACAKFKESYGLDPSAGTLLNLAVCHEKSHSLALALEEYRKVVATLPEKDDRIPFAKERLAELERRVPHLTLLLAPGAPPETSVTLDGADIPSASLGLARAVDPGDHTVVVRAPGSADQNLTVTVREAESRQLLVGSSVKGETPARAPEPAAPAAPPDSAKGGHSPVLGYVIGGIGVVGIAVGGITGAMVLHKKSVVDGDCADDVCTTQEGIDAASSGRTLSAVSTVAFALGAVGLGAGIVLVVTSRSSSDASSKTALRALAIPNGAALSLSRGF